MATITLTADTNYSSLTVANDDTIDCAGFILTLDVQPTETGIQVTSPATNGRVVFSGAWVLPTWDFFAGASTTAGMIGELPVGAEIGSITGGSVSNARGVVTNNGTITTAVGGTGGNAHCVITNNGIIIAATGGIGGGSKGVVTNNGTITTATAGSAIQTEGVSTNNGDIGVVNAATAPGVNLNQGTITTAVGGTGGNAWGVATNNGTIATAIGGATSSAQGVFGNNGTVINAIASAFANGVQNNSGIVFQASDSAGTFGVRDSFSAIKLVDGPNYQSRIVTLGTARPVLTVYSLGPLSELATLDPGIEVIELSEGSGGATINPFRQQVIG